MEIRIKCSCGVDSCPEWAIVELQGVVEAQPSFQDCLQNLVIGQLCRSSSQESYTLTIGYHELTGSKVPLKKPMLVLKKVKCMDVDQSSDNHSSGTEMEVVGIIRHRILFKTRPKALISMTVGLVLIYIVWFVLVAIHTYRLYFYNAALFETQAVVKERASTTDPSVFIK